MSYGWKRTEILGALTNGIFLVSLAVYITLETIPEIISPETPPSGITVVIIAAAGLAINTIATVVFHFTGQSHGHSHAGGGHGHSHGGSDHGHSHGEEDHGHSHAKKKKPKSSETVHLISEYEMEEHGHSHSEKHGHSHSDKKDHGHSHSEGHGHSHSEKKDHGHSHSHGEKEDHGHSHSHGEKEPKKKKVVDQNVKAVCLHYFGDMVSSFFVLVMGILITLFPPSYDNPETWTEYIDPVTSLLIVVLILITTVPLIKGCFMILLQRTPPHIQVPELKNKIMTFGGVLNVHDFHVWQLVDGMIITSLHIMIEENTDFGVLAKKIKKLLHKSGIHSSAIQPEFVTINHPNTDNCLQHCVKDCSEDWCCKEDEKGKKVNLTSSGSKITYSSIQDPV